MNAKTNANGAAGTSSAASEPLVGENSVDQRGHDADGQRGEHRAAGIAELGDDDRREGRADQERAGGRQSGRCVGAISTPARPDEHEADRPDRAAHRAAD